MVSCTGNLKRVENKATVIDSIGPSSLQNVIKDDSLFEVHTMAAVFYNPDTTEMDSMRMANKEQFLTALEENSRYQKLAIDYLNSKNIKVFVTDKRYLQFLNNSGRPYMVDKKKSGHMWGLLLYDHENTPRESDM